MLLAFGCAGSARAATETAPAILTVDAATGSVISDHGGGQPHHPASLTKLMSAYVAFRALEAGQAKWESPITVSERAAGQGGSVLGLRKGDVITLGAALKAMIVRSGNDAAVAVAEHIAGSESAFAERMTAEARRLGMGSSSFRNATGMTAAGHVTTPRDMAILALAILRDFPSHRALFSSLETSWKGRSYPTVNGFLANFSGAEGMKTGFTCPAGYNLVALARRGGHRAVAVIMGAGSSAQRQAVVRSAMDAALRDGAVAARPLASLPNTTEAPPDLSAAACGLRSGGEWAHGSTNRAPPAGWGLEVAFGTDRAKVQRALATVHREMAGRLGGGSPLVVIKPRDGLVRYRGLIAGLSERRAIDTCLAERAKMGEDRCLVLTPTMMSGALEDERRFRMFSAR
ncbi:D-alanyl-D-alanine carboxypeptidase family protein [Paramagnetospirillum kuznetsovii]|uniref:D-alanyl-D-alanine carboxypeptidase family protein n=1 Tax=Paramagnetospirillum kuznetsovii TaxID=2053833 RepID=UPI001EFEA29C|nr:D-alanyl-D-alanine carboxypeptidase family protein [Paramagnetospirillum kuznetsovii]